MIKPRLVFVPDYENKSVKEYRIQPASWAGGFAASQKQKNIAAIHEMFLKASFGKGKKILEVSTKSPDILGTRLSAFNLLKYVPSLDKKVPLECVFQAGKVFENGGPYLDLLEVKPGEAKKDPRIKNSGRIIAFEFEGKRYPTTPLTYFYDTLYMEALDENPEIAGQLLEYDAFTDIEFNPEKSINCQAKTCALYRAMHGRSAS